jgi:carboxyl-terminal processing protease
MSMVGKKNLQTDVTIGKFMKKTLFTIGLGMAVATGCFAEMALEKQNLLVNRTLQFLRFGHYSKLEYNDELSKRTYDQYLNKLDFQKQFFTKEDIAKFQKYEYLLDDMMKTPGKISAFNLDDYQSKLAKQFEFYNLVTSTYKSRIEEYEKLSNDYMDKPFNYFKLDSLEYDFEKRDYVKSDTELRERWRKILKYQVIGRYMDLIEEKAGADSTGKTYRDADSNFVYLHDSVLYPEIEEEARTKVKKTQERWINRLKKRDNEDYFYLYLDAIANSYGPHTSFMAPQVRDDFDIRMSGSLEGIGATLSEDGSYIKIVEIVPGSPSWKSKELKRDDLILKVAQGADEPVDIADMPLKDAVKLIRGPKGSEVRLTIKKPDGEIKVVPLIRDEIVLAETFAKSAIIEHEDFDEKYGYVYLPKFYREFSKKSGTHRTSTGDVEKALIDMQKEGIDGVVLDLRNNGGGALLDAIGIAGLFFDVGPVVQVNNKVRPPEVLEDKDSRVVCDKPVVILINEYSASASEILAAALQDNHRAVVVGSKHSFGKGTVQNLFDFDRRMKREVEKFGSLGTLKLTIQKFYRINGESTQYKGVESDIILPSRYDKIEVGERRLKYSLPHDVIKNTEYSLMDIDEKTLAYLEDRSNKRVEESPAFDNIKELRDFTAERQDDSIAQISIEKVIEEREYIRERNKKYKEDSKPKEYLKIVYTNRDKEELTDDEKDELNEWKKGIRKNIYIDEAVSILHDLAKIK